MISCCKDCIDREPGCHDRCERYIAEKIDYVRKKENIHKIKSVQGMLNSVRSAGISNFKNGRGRKR